MSDFLRGLLAATALVSLLLIASLLVGWIVAAERLRRQLAALSLENLEATADAIRRQLEALAAVGERIARAGAEAAAAVRDFNANAFVERRSSQAEETSGFVPYDEETMAELERRLRERAGQT
jgi:hypothetical protein